MKGKMLNLTGRFPKQDTRCINYKRKNSINWTLKFKNFYSSNDTIKREKSKSRKYLQYIYPTKDSHREDLKSPYQSVRMNDNLRGKQTEDHAAHSNGGGKSWGSGVSAGRGAASEAC